MAGYIHDPLQIINLIADNLRDRYKSGFPVLKEIIQNADDAGSSGENIDLEFGLSPGIPTAQHPLLQGPALYFLNNGHFTESDNRAIRSFGLNRKAVEQSSIGKFGLGMKSVFHFCEAFFFLAKSREKEYAEILNPWSSKDEFTSLHADWDSFSPQDGELIREQVRVVLDAMDLARGTFFLLWLPLRKNEHLLVKDGGAVGSIINEFPGDDATLLAFLSEPDLAQRIASLVPLLRRITKIRFWDGGTAPVFEVQLDQRSKRVSSDIEEALTPREMIGAAIYTCRERGNQKFITSYTGKERLLDSPALNVLKLSPLWPKTFVRNEAGQSEEAPDKAQGHCAALFSSSDEKGRGQLIVNWAVFLPIGEKRNETKRCGGDRTFRLTLHGYFFVDAGRADIEGLHEDGGLTESKTIPSNEAELRSLWNSRLSRQGTLPLVLPALEGFVSKTRLSADDRWNLSQGLAESQIFARYRKVICANFSWVCRLTRKGREWHLLPTDQTIRSLPEPPLSVPDRPWTTFPQLESFENHNFILVLKGAPHLHATPLPQWNETDLLELLQLDERSVFTDQGCLDYLLAFLSDDTVRPFLNVGDLQGRLQEIFKRAFSTLGTGLRQHRSKVQEFVSLLQPEMRYPIKQDAPEVIQGLQNSTSSVLILSAEFDAQKTPGTALLSIDDAFALLHKLHDLIVHHDQDGSEKVGDICREIAGDILQKQPEEQHRILLARAGNLKILAGYDCTREKVVTLSAAEIQARHSGNLLFQYSQGINLTQQLGLASRLQAAVKESVIVIKRGIIDLVFDKNTRIPPCNAEGVLDALGRNALSLQPMQNRRPLLQDTAGTDLSSPGRVRGLRYLLHGLAEHFEDTTTLWVSGYDENAVWGKLWKQLQRDVPNNWTLLDRQLVATIAQDKWPKLTIQEIKPKAILDEIREVGTEKVVGLVLSREEINTLLRELVNDEELWKKLPFHETIQGKLVRIVPGKTYLASETDLPEELLENVGIILPSDDKQIRRAQGEWIDPLSADSVVQIVLRHGEPLKFWSLILNNISTSGRALETEELLETAWLLDKEHNPVKPADVINLEGLQDEVDRVLVHARGAFSSPDNLHPDIQGHPHFAILKQYCFASERQGFEKLALLLGETSDYRLGTLALPDDQVDLVRIVKACIRFPISLRLPGWGLLDKALEIFPPELSRVWLFDELVKPISPGRIITILHWLKEEHGRVGRDSKKYVLFTFNKYLAAFVTEGGTAQQLSELALLNCEGNWKPAQELCVEAEGVAESHLLDDEQRQILTGVIVHADRQQAHAEGERPKKRDLQPEITASVRIMEEFFADWKEIVADEIICAFLTLLGDDPGMLALTEQYRGRHTVDWVRDKMPWQVHRRLDHLGRQEWMYGLERNQAFAQHRFIVRCSEGDLVEVFSILGAHIQVPLKSQFASLISGGLYYEPPDGEIINIRLMLRAPRLQDVSPAELSGYLRSSAEYLLKKAYNQKDYDLGRLWEELDKSEQLDIRIAQQLVLNNIPIYLGMMKVQKHPLLHSLINQWDDARTRREEYHDSAHKREFYEKEQRDTVGKIQNLLRNDEEVQGIVLNAVRAKMRDFQYTLASIPFELFQNADDAVVELLAMQVYPDTPDINAEDVFPEDAKRFVVHQQDNALTFVHWGRRVNEVGSAGFPGREKGFHRDLEKMLVLSSSDKSEESKVTGKFGLGFKSVLLACEKPVLVSGQLATEIIAGLCPLPLNDANEFRRKINALSSGGRRKGTLIELPLTDRRPQEITQAFTQVAGVLTIFSKQIRRIDIDGDAECSWEWNPELIPLAHPARLELGELFLTDGFGQKRLSLHFRFSEGGILIGLGPQGFRALPTELPVIWVVAPTKEKDGLGFAINAPFDLDAGRARLAGNSEINKQKAYSLGRVFGKALQQLHSKIQEDWKGVKTQFRFEEDLSEHTFWESLWKVLGDGGTLRGSDEVGVLVTQMLCGDNGLGHLITHADAMPNGLWRNFQKLTRPANIRTILKGCLADEDIFNVLIQWDFFQDYFGAWETVISDKIFTTAKKILPDFGQTTTQWRSVRLVDVLLEFIKKDKKILPQTAEVLGEILNVSELKTEALEKEREQVEKALQAFLFKSEEGSFQRANNLLVAQKHNQANPDESKRSSFAPKKNVLSDEYKRGCLDFFFACRDKISLPVEEMIDWLLEAETEEVKGNGLRYLLEGEHGEKIAQVLRTEGFYGTWLAELRPDSPCFSGWKQDEIFEILFRKLPSIDDLHRLHAEVNEDSYEVSGKILQGYDPKEILKKIHLWWMDTKEDHLEEYEWRTYPETISLDLSEDDVGRIDRKSWLILFCLAHFHTMGRQRDVQHKGFIDKCLQKGWWDTFSKDLPENRSDEWMRVLEEYIDEQVDFSEYEIWMNRFPAIYKFSRWLEEYKDAFLSIKRTPNLSGIDGILKTKVNVDFQGGGICAPPIEKSLGIGACFTLRELKRKQIITGNQAIPFCYVPVKRVRDFCKYLGCAGLTENGGIDNSKIIHHFLCSNLGETHADFSNCYDIPLQWAAEKEDVLRMILN